MSLTHAMSQRYRKTGLKKAESLVEVIMAIFVVALGSGVATSLIISALQANEFSRDNLVALNLAVEGIEVMRDIRDADWLKFSYDKENCWNMRPDTPADKPCTDAAAKPIEATDSNSGYTITPSPWGWVLPDAPIGSALDLSSSGSGNDPYQLGYYDMDTGVDSDGNGDASHDHDVIITKGITVSPPMAASGDTIFYRMIQVEYPSCSTFPHCESMNIVSTVQWRAQGVAHQVVLTTHLTNYQKVKVQA